MGKSYLAPVMASLAPGNIVTDRMGRIHGFFDITDI